MSEHNPVNLTPEQVGVAEGWRLLNEEEIMSSNWAGAMTLIELWRGTLWDYGRLATGSWYGNVVEYTYRTKLTPAELRKARGLEPIDAAGEMARSQDGQEIDRLRTENAELQTKLAYAEDAANKGDKARSIAGALEEELEAAKKEEKLQREIKENYASAARIIALHLHQFCDESLDYDDMIADAGRKAGAEVDRLTNELEAVKKEQDALKGQLALKQKALLSCCEDLSQYVCGEGEMQENERIQAGLRAENARLTQERDEANAYTRHAESFMLDALKERDQLAAKNAELRKLVAAKDEALAKCVLWREGIAITLTPDSISEQPAKEGSDVKCHTVKYAATSMHPDAAHSVASNAAPSSDPTCSGQPICPTCGEYTKDCSCAAPDPAKWVAMEEMRATRGVLAELSQRITEVMKELEASLASLYTMTKERDDALAQVKYAHSLTLNACEERDALRAENDALKAAAVEYGKAALIAAERIAELEARP